MTNALYKVISKNLPNAQAPLASDLNQLIDTLNGANDIGAITLAAQITAPSITGITATAAAGTALGIGAYRYQFTYVVGNKKSDNTIIYGNETSPSASVTVTTTSGNQAVSLAGLPTTWPSTAVALRIYRTAVGGADGTQKLVTTITTPSATYTDTTTDVTLGAAAPTTNTTGTTLPGSAVSGPVASATNATNATNATTATNATGVSDGIITPAKADLGTWGLVSRIQGLIIAPEGSVTDNGAGVVTFGSTVMVMNPASGSWVRVAAGSYTLAPWAYLYIDLPPTITRGTTITPTVGTWSDVDRNYDGKDRIILAQRVKDGGGPVYFRGQVKADIEMRDQAAGTTLYSDTATTTVNSTTYVVAKSYTFNTGGTKRRFIIPSFQWNLAAQTTGSTAYGKASWQVGNGAEVFGVEQTTTAGPLSYTENPTGLDTVDNVTNITIRVYLKYGTTNAQCSLLSITGESRLKMI